MFIPIALIIALHFFVSLENFETPQRDPAPQTVTVKDLFRKLSTSDAIALFGREHLLDSSVSPLTDTRIKWLERFLVSGLGRH